MRILVADDSAFMRKAISSMLSSEPSIEVVATAKNGAEALELARSLRPDLITLDVEMPEMDGLTALRKIMTECPTHVIMISSLTTEGSHAALTALRHGAADVFAKEQSHVSLSITSIRDELVARVLALGSSSRARFGKPAAAPVPPAGALTSPPTFRAGQFDVLCIGSSTGGPPVLEQILSSLPATFSAPVVVAQHMPLTFTRSLAERLNGMCRLPVVHIENNMRLAPRTIHICPGGQNTHIVKERLARWTLTVNDEPRTAIYKPSVDALLLSAANEVGARTLAVVLTGMGDDGLQGGRALHQKGGTLIAQNEETCVVYGMPRAISKANLVVANLAPDAIVTSLATLAERGTSTATPGTPGIPGTSASHVTQSPGVRRRAG